MISIRAAAAVEYDDLDSYVVSFREFEDGESLGVDLSVSTIDDPQDEELGMDTYCISTPEGASHYGGIESCVLRDKVLSLIFDRDAQEVLGVDSHMDLDLRIDGAKLQEIRDGLSRIFDGDDLINLVLD